MAKKAEMVRRIKNLQGQMNQAAFARYLGVPQSRISEYLAGKRPTAEMCVRLAKLAPYPDNLWFLEQAGLKRDDILSAATKIMEGRSAPPVEGEIVRVPRFRVTEHGREEAGPPIPLPTQCVPHPLATICLCLDEKSPRIGESPRGLILLDTSIEGTKWRDEFSGRVVMLDYMPRDVGPWPLGLYMGRIFRQGPLTQLPRAIWTDIMLEPLTKDATSRFGAWLPVGSYVESGEALAAAQGDKEKSEAVVNEFRQRALSNLHLSDGVRILGKVIGRLTGHLEMEQAGGAE